MPTATGSARGLSSSKASKFEGSATSSKPLYASQSALPRLPVPTLSSTFHKYQETIQPLQTSEEHSKSKALINDFLTSDLSKTLQERLESRAKGKDSWLSEWWNDAAYMGYRGRIVPNVSYFYLHKQGLGKGASQEDRAAELVRATVEFKNLVDR
jgi:carnitine O-acetyltransferase